jgi:hypothetical protein
MDQRHIPAGTKLTFGAPTEPMHETRSTIISDVVATVPGLVEAHLPQCLIEGDTAPRQALVVVVRSKADIPNAARQIASGISKTVPSGLFLDILPFFEGSVPAGVRESGCQIFHANTKPWWKIW